MTLKQLLSKFDIKLSLNAGIVKANIHFKDHDKKAAWELYIELLTRITTQPLPDEDGIEKTALESIYSIFSLTREVLKKYGSETIEFSKIAIPILNQIIRPFTAKWHKLSQENAFEEPQKCKEFREELKQLQAELKKYNQLLAEITRVEDLTSLENENEKIENKKIKINQKFLQILQEKYKLFLLFILILHFIYFIDICELINLMKHFLKVKFSCLS